MWFHKCCLCRTLSNVDAVSGISQITRSQDELVLTSETCRESESESIASNNAGSKQTLSANQVNNRHDNKHISPLGGLIVLLQKVEL